MIKLMECPYCGHMLMIETVDDPVKQYYWKCSNCEYSRPNTGIESVSLNELRDEIYEDAVAHGLWEWADTYENRPDLQSECAQLVWNEALELDEAYKTTESYIEELADIVIVCMSIAGKLGIDIDAAVRKKMAINKERPWKHEGEKE